VSNYIDNVGGVTVTVGLDDYIVSGGADTYDPIIGTLTDGATYALKVQFLDIADGTDFETGVYTWVDATNTLTRDTINTSSNAGAPVNWGAGTKLISVVADSQMLADMELMVEGSTKKILTSTERTNIAASKVKTDLITVTQPVNLDTMEADIAAMSSGIVYKGNWDASAGTFPGAGAAQIGDLYTVSVAGTVGGITFYVNDALTALTTRPMTVEIIPLTIPSAI